MTHVRPPGAPNAYQPPSIAEKSTGEIGGYTLTFGRPVLPAMGFGGPLSAHAFGAISIDIAAPITPISPVMILLSMDYDFKPVWSGGLGARRQAGWAPGERTTIGTAGKYAAISERDLRRAAVP